MQNATRPNVSPEDVAHFDRLAARWWDADGPSRPLFALNPARLGFIRGEAEGHFGLAKGRRPLEGLKVLDVGCGGGIATEPLARLGGKVTGMDAAEENIRIAREHAQSAGLAIDYRHATSDTLILEGYQADIVIALEVIEHVPDPARFVADLAQMLAPNGLLILSTPNRTAKSFASVIVAAEYVLGLVPRGSHDWRHFIKPEELQPMLADAGLAMRTLAGLSMDLMTGHWSVTKDSSVDYILSATKPFA